VNTGLTGMNMRLRETAYNSGRKQDNQTQTDKSSHQENSLRVLERVERLLRTDLQAFLAAFT
jgi:hypothetical protein